MKIGFTYKNDTPSFEKEIPSSKGWDTKVMEIVVEGNDGNKRRLATAEYIASMISAFRGLINMDELEVDKFKYEGTIIGDVSTIEESKKEFATLSNIYNFIVFNLYDPSIKEMLYVTRNSDVTARERGALSVDDSNYVLNNIVIDPEINGAEFKKRVASLISSVHTCLEGYEVDYDFKTHQFIYYYKGRPLKSIEDIIEDDIFLFFKLVEVTFNKGTHVGVYFIDCNRFSTPVIRVLAAYINLFYIGNRTIFLYNLKTSKRKELSDLHHDVILVPNHKQHKTNKSKKN